MPIRSEIAELPEWITRQETARLLNAADSTIKKLEKAGKIKSRLAAYNRVEVEVESLLSYLFPGIEYYAY